MSLLDRICASSYRNFHIKGFDYLCLHRSPELTLKAYFFEDECAGLPELVMPHDHRYGFSTTILAGQLRERRYRQGHLGEEIGSRAGRDYNEFEYRTPLNGGSGFSWKRRVHLIEESNQGYHPGSTYFTSAADIHTLAHIRIGTVIVLTQFADEIPVERPTRAFRSGADREPPELSGLYDRMDPDTALQRIDHLRQLGWPTNPLLEPAA